MQLREGFEIGPIGCISGFKQEWAIDVPCSKLQGIFDPHGCTFILIAR
jgi:hypothetical protein